MHEENLMEFGLSEKEAKTYLTLLKLETATATMIAKETQINRSSVYVVLESLMKQKFVYILNDNGTQKYIAAPPQRLLKFAEDRAEKQQKIKDAIKKTVLELKYLHKDTKHRPSVMMYEGEKILRDGLFEMPFFGSKDLKVFEDPVELANYAPEYIEMECLGRKERGIKMYAIHPNTTDALGIKNKYMKLNPNDQIVSVPYQKLKSNKHGINFAIYGDYVSFLSLKESYSIEIKSPEIADTLRNIFDLAWIEARRLQNNPEKKILPRTLRVSRRYKKKNTKH